MSRLSELDYRVSQLPKSYYGFANKYSVLRDESVYISKRSADKIERCLDSYFEKGFDETELWSLDFTFYEFIIPRLNCFYDNISAYPSIIGDVMINDQPVTIDGKRIWTMIIKKMITGFELAHSESTELLTNKKMQNKVKLAQTLFAKYLDYLWS